QAVIRDVTERKRADEALAHQALHDALTGLPNRVLLMDRLQQTIAAGRRDEMPVSLLLMDLDRFKEVNDTLGHFAGDLLLQQDGQLTGVEALVRWQHPVRGLLAPDEFIPVAEQAALIEPLSQWVVRTAVAQASEWRDAGFEIPVAVNLSMRNLHNEELPERIS